MKCSYHTHATKGWKKSFAGDDYVYYLDYGGGFMNVYICPNSYIIYVKCVEFFVYQSNLNKNVNKI